MILPSRSKKKIFFKRAVAYIGGAALFFALIFSKSGSAHSEESKPRAMWVWDARIPASKQASLRLFKFCKKQNIKTLFITAYDVSLKHNINHLKRFNRMAHNEDIAVHALAGDPRWSQKRYHHLSMKWVESIVNFNQIARSKERFDGIHYDIEPYIMGRKWEENSSTLLQEYLELLYKTSEYLRGTGSLIHFSCDIPFWYDDDETYHIPWGRFIKPASFHVLDIVDSVVVMDYRNFTKGPNGSIKLVEYEMNYADKIGKKVYIGQETKENLRPEYITFANQEVDYMEECFAELEATYNMRASYAGIAIHHYQSYRRFLQRSK